MPAKVSHSPKYITDILNRSIVVTDGGHFLEVENKNRP